jgi:hypothetical protein
MSSPTAAAAAAEPRSPREVEIPAKFQCRLGTKCLTVNAKYDAWKERTALRARGLLVSDPSDKAPMRPDHGQHVYAARALTECKDWFRPCGHFVCNVSPAERDDNLTCAQVHDVICKSGGRYDFAELRQAALARGLIVSKRSRVTRSTPEVCSCCLLS